MWLQGFTRKWNIETRRVETTCWCLACHACVIYETERDYASTFMHLKGGADLRLSRSLIFPQRAWLRNMHQLRTKTVWYIPPLTQGRRLIHPTARTGASFQHLLGVGSEPTPAQCLFYSVDLKFPFLYDESCVYYIFSRKKYSKGVGIALKCVAIENANIYPYVFVVDANTTAGYTVDLKNHLLK